MFDCFKTTNPTKIRSFDEHHNYQADIEGCVKDHYLTDYKECLVPNCHIVNDTGHDNNIAAQEL